MITETKGICPICLKQISAMRVFRNGAWYQEKECPRHGRFSTVIWRGSEDMSAWIGAKENAAQEEKLPCPDACGLCEKHLRSTCCALLEVTDRCNLKCRFCFADNTQKADLPLGKIKEQIHDLAEKTNGALLQISGGEPTLRDDLPEIVAFAKEAGCKYIQLNTNGIRLADDPTYVRALSEAGLSFVFLQFDGVDDRIYRTLRGEPLFKVKEKAIEMCGKERLGVTLVPTLVPGVNTHQIGDIIRYVIANVPVIRGVHFQPVSYFGRIPQLPDDAKRYTLGELVDDIVEQTAGLITRKNLVPSACDHPLCGLHGDYIALSADKILALSERGRPETSCCCSHEDPAVQNREYIATRWQRNDNGFCCTNEDPSSLKGFLQWKQHRGFTITSMCFQDAGNLDLERLRRCSLHVYRNGRIVPFCAAYLSGLRNELVE